MNDNSPVRRISQSLGRHIWLGIVIVFVLVAGIGGVAAVAEINGAVIAPGAIVVEGNVKKVQHQEGGIVGEIHIEDGHQVEAGDLLIRLDDTVAKANLSVTSKRLRQSRAQEARLAAEWRFEREITFPEELEQEAETDKTVTELLENQQSLLTARLDGLEGRKNQLSEQIAQFEEQIKGLKVQKKAKEISDGLVREQLEDFESLLEKGLVTESQVIALKRDQSELMGERGGLIAEIARAKEAISERKIQIIQIDDEFREDVLQSLQEIRAEIAELVEQKITAEDRMKRIEIRAPRSGNVHQLNVHTIGGVISPADLLMLIVPEDVELIVEARVLPTDVDQIQQGQSAVVRMAALDQRTTPELTAKVTSISADLARDDATGETFYTARLFIPDTELEKLNGQILIPGMPVESFIQTGERTVLSYLVKPLQDQIAHALREN